MSFPAACIFPKVVVLGAVGLAISAVPAMAQVLSSGPPASPGVLATGTGSPLNRLAGHAVPATIVTDDGQGGPIMPLALVFYPGSDRLTASATRLLDKLGASLRHGALAGRAVRITGHADRKGSTAAKRDMAARRARAVALYLEQNFGLDPARLHCSGTPFVRRGARMVMVDAAAE